MSHLPANWLPPEPPKPPRSRGLGSLIPAAITFGCALLLSCGSLVGALSTCNFSMQSAPPSPRFTFFLDLFIFSGIVLLVSAVWVIIAAVIAFFSRKDANP
jgi:hypothetical protein